MPRRAWMSISFTRCNHSRQRTEKGVKTMNKELLKAGLVRSVRTCAQTAVAAIGTATAMGQVNWISVLSTTALAGIISVLMSLAGLPEVKEK